MPKWVWIAVVVAVLLVGGGAAAAVILPRLTRSRKADELGVSNEPADDRTRRRLEYLSSYVPRLLAILRQHDPGADITSGYRSPPVNAAVGGAVTSRHQYGLAVDFGNGWGIAGSVSAAVWLRDHPDRAGIPLRDVLAEDDHLHVELVDPLGELDPPGRKPQFLWEAAAAGVAGARFQVIA